MIVFLNKMQFYAFALNGIFNNIKRDYLLFHIQINRKAIIEYQFFK